MPSVYIKTYGCQMNERDSEAVAAQLVAKGYTLAPSEAAADVILLNTCSVRDNAEQTALGKMTAVAGEIRARRRDVVLGFMGCMAQSRGQELIDRLPDVDLVLGTQKFHRAADYLDEIISGKRDKIVDVAEEQGSEATIREHLLNGSAKKSVTAFVSIMQGCNQHCTFCIVPSTRGEERNRTIPDIVAECRELVSRGVKEVTLLGQIVTSYGKRLSPDELFGGASVPASRLVSSFAPPQKSPFVQLLEAVHEIDGLERIRFTSPHPKGYGDDLVEAYARLPRLVESAHIPVQSGSDRVLKAMHRGYTREKFLGIIGKLRAVKPGIGITTDIIVGFPGETETDFEETLSLCREVRIRQRLHFQILAAPRHARRRHARPGAAGNPRGAQSSAARNPQRHRQSANTIPLSGGNADSGRRAEQKKFGAFHRPDALQQNRRLRRQRASSRRIAGRENHARRLLHALRRPGDFGMTAVFGRSVPLKSLAHDENVQHGRAVEPAASAAARIVRRPAGWCRWPEPRPLRARHWWPLHRPARAAVRW